MFGYNCSFLIGKSFPETDKQVIWKPKVHYENIEDYEAEVEQMETWIREELSDPDAVQNIVDGDRTIFFGIIEHLLFIIKKPQKKLNNSSREEEWARTIASVFENDLICFCEFLIRSDIDNHSDHIENYIDVKFDRERDNFRYGQGFEAISLFYDCDNCGERTQKIWGDNVNICEDCWGDSEAD